MPKTQIEFRKAVYESVDKTDLKKFKKLLSPKGGINLLGKADVQGVVDVTVNKIDNMPQKYQVDFYGAMIKSLDVFYGRYINDYIKYLPFMDGAVAKENKEILGTSGLFAAVAKYAKEHDIKFNYKPGMVDNMAFHNELTALYMQNYIKGNSWNNESAFWQDFANNITTENTLKVFDNMSRNGMNPYDKKNYFNAKILRYVVIPYIDGRRYEKNSDKDIVNIIMKLPKDNYALNAHDMIVMANFLTNAKIGASQLKKIKEILGFSEIDKVVENKTEKLKVAAAKDLKLHFGITAGEKFGGVEADKRAEKKIADKKRLFKINAARVIAKGNENLSAKKFSEINEK